MKNRFCLLLLILALNSLSPQLHAMERQPADSDAEVNIIVVDMPQDLLDPMDNKCSLREALHNANNNTRFSEEVGECPAGSGILTDVIVLQSGVVYELIPSGAGQFEVFHNAALPLDLRIETDGDLPATLHQVTEGRRVMHINGARVSLNNLILTGGNGEQYGGGIYIEDSEVELDRVDFVSNQAETGGAALYLFHSTVTLNDSEVLLNHSGTPGVMGLGGAIFNRESNLTINQSLIRANSSFFGGAIYSTGALQIFNSHFSINESTGLAGQHAGGGAIYASGGSPSTLLVSDSLFTSNSAPDGDGGAVYLALVEPASIKHTVFESNQALNGGALFSRPWAHPHIEGGRFLHNQAVQDGGAIRSPNLSIDNELLKPMVELHGNSAGGDGGAIHARILHGTRLFIHGNEADARGGGMFIDGVLSIADSRVESNMAGTHGGALYKAVAEPLNTSSILRSSFMFNQANGLAGQGGGLWLAQRAQMANITVHGNSAATGGGIYLHDDAEYTAIHMTLSGHIAGQDLVAWGELTLQNSIIATPGQPNCANTGVPIISLGKNLSNDSSCLGLDESIDLIGIQPKLLEPANGGHRTRVQPLAADSPAIDAADQAGCSDPDVAGIDQRHGMRPAGPGCDIGAFEFAAEVLHSRIFSDRLEENE